MKTLVIGANGSLGRVVLERLAKEGAVVAGTRTAEFSSALEQVSHVSFDFDKPATFAKALEGVTAVFLQAPPLDVSANERLTPFIEAMKATGVKRVVFNSAYGVDHNDEAPLRKIELQLMDAAFDLTILRPNFFMENFTTGFAVPGIEHNQVIVANAADKALAFVSVQDIAAMVAAVLADDRHIGKAYNLTGKEALSHEAVAALLSKKYGKTIQYIALSAAEMKAGAVENGLPESAADYLVMLYDVASKGLLSDISDDIPKVLGKETKTFSDILGV